MFSIAMLRLFHYEKFLYKNSVETVCLSQGLAFSAVNCVNERHKKLFFSSNFCDKAETKSYLMLKRDKNLHSTSPCNYPNRNEVKR